MIKIFLSFLDGKPLQQFISLFDSKVCPLFSLSLPLVLLDVQCSPPPFSFPSIEDIGDFSPTVYSVNLLIYNLLCPQVSCFEEHFVC